MPSFPPSKNRIRSAPLTGTAVNKQRSTIYMQRIYITAADGYQLSAIYATPVAQPAGTVVISSATGVKKEFYINFAQFLVQHGYAVIMFDYRGVGGSAPHNLKSSSAYMHHWGTLDMNAVLDYLVFEKGLTDIIWMGHSIGGQLVGFLENRQHIKKVIAINAALGYWGYHPFPMKLKVWALWYLISPVLIKLYGYGTMKKVGWGEDLPKNVILEWRRWCMSKHYFRSCLRQQLGSDTFANFTTPITALYTSDDDIANDKTVPLMMRFFPNAPVTIIKLPVEDYTRDKAGHTGLFRRRFEHSLWLLLLKVVQK
jgi:predicted alpha/beta hydrolase